MEFIRSIMDQALQMLTTIELSDIIDILIVAYLIYKALLLIRKTNSTNLARGLFLLLAMFLLSEVLGLNMIRYVLRKAFELGLIALVVLFQPELRRLFERIGSGFTSNRAAFGNEMESAVMQTVLACREMSASKTGALIIFERKIRLDDIMSTGTIINADATAELMKNVFFNKAPLHDGALIIRNGRLAAAGCVLPLTKSTNLSKELGMRHRAGIGLSEQSDAVVIIVSEETGAISVAIEGMLKRHLSPSTLEKILHSELMNDQIESSNKSLLGRLTALWKRAQNEKQESDQ